MRTNYKISLTATFIFLILSQYSHAQYASKKVKSKHQIYTDSLKQVKYDYTFPVWGQAVYKKGFDIPYPIGIMGNYVWAKQGIIIDNMQLGLKSEGTDIPLTPVDFLEFGDNISTVNTVNFRPDIWVFPFLNVYGLYGQGNSRTEVNLVKPVEFKSIVEQGIRTLGFGVMGAGGIGPVWFSVDANFTWNKPELLEEPTRVNVLGIRFGHTFVFKNKPDRNFAVWAGGMRVKLDTETSGAIKMSEALPPETWDRIDEVVSNYWNWYDNEATDRQKNVADRILTPIVDRLENADGEAVISYAMDKQVKELWNGVVGAQFQLNKRWMLRTEWGIVGDRKSALASVNYRFLM